MKAVVYAQYGSPEVLHLQEVAKPVPGDDEVLVKVHAVSINALNGHLMRGRPTQSRLAFGFPHSKAPILGADIAGRVEAVGKSVTPFQPGDEVCGGIGKGGVRRVCGGARKGPGVETGHCLI